MKKVLVATEKPFAKPAVDGIRKIIESAGYELILLEKYSEILQLVCSRAALDCPANPYPHYYTHFKAMAGEVYRFLPVTPDNLLYKGI